MQLNKKLNLGNNLKIIQTTRNSKTNNFACVLCLFGLASNLIGVKAPFATPFFKTNNT
jgi:hypothetical protein